MERSEERLNRPRLGAATLPAFRICCASVLLVLAICCNCNSNHQETVTPPDASIPEFVTEWPMTAASMAADPLGRLHVASAYDPLIRIFDVNGDEVGQWAVVFRGDTLGPCQLVFDNDRPIVASYDMIVFLDKFFKPTSSWRQAYNGPGDIGADAMALGEDGSIYVIYDRAKNRIVRYSSTGTVEKDWMLGGRDNINAEFPGIAIGRTDVVYVANRYANTIDLYSRDGEFVRAIGANGELALNLPSGLDIVGETLYVADLGNYKIRKLTLWGQPLGDFFAAASDGNAGDNPQLVVVGGNHVYVSFLYAIASYGY